MVSDLTSSSLGANGVICLLNSSNISNAVRFLELNFTVSKPAASAREREKKGIMSKMVVLICSRLHIAYLVLLELDQQ